MANLKIEIDVDSIAEIFGEIRSQLEADILLGVKQLAASTQAKVKEMAAQELHSTLKIFNDNLRFEEIDKNVYVITLEEGALFIEDGIPPNTDMKEHLLKNGKMAKNGNKYKVIPFDHSKPPTQMTPMAQTLVGQLKQKLKAEKIPFKKIEKNADGTPKLGRLHTFRNVDSSWPSKKSAGPGLNGISIYQTQDAATGKVKRDIMTFRTVTSGPGSQGKWINPGVEAHKFLDRAFDWAMQEWETEFLPAILDKYK